MRFGAPCGVSSNWGKRACCGGLDPPCAAARVDYNLLALSRTNNAPCDSVGLLFPTLRRGGDFGELDGRQSVRSVRLAAVQSQTCGK